MNNPQIELSPTHEWEPIEEEDGIYYFCHNCTVCSCHCPVGAQSECTMDGGL